ncbi:putative short-chain dehydrogenase [Rosellinia necatrix]|uniref:Putative short-chain dehydrogenase n=1 Tax=Rosellinia necatrix TaxID=77044 RepID=A0A1W2TQD8_ROSNE|nr:putative short-chain dehydrogenase [Rosellinia necatrix]
MNRNSHESLPLSSFVDNVNATESSHALSVSTTKSPNISSIQNLYHMLTPWTWELMCIIFSIVIFITIVQILLIFDAERVPDWGPCINSNASCEWSSGALKLLSTVLTEDAITALAILVILVSFLVGPFVHQANRNMSCVFPAPEKPVFAPVARYVPQSFGNGIVQGIRGAYESPTAESRFAITSCAMDPLGLANQIKVTRPTANCTFPWGDPIGIQNVAVTDKVQVSHSPVGLCNMCIDVTTRLTIFMDQSRGAWEHYALPNGRNVSRDGGSATTILSTEANLDWIGDLMTPQLASASRWAFANVTLLSSESKLAVACVLHPCLKSYTISVENGAVNETLARTDPMQANLAGQQGDYDYDSSNRINAVNNSNFIYVAVKTPYQVNETLYNLHNISSDPTQRILSFVNATNPEFYRVYNISAPEPCIYQLDNLFGGAPSEVLGHDIFDGYCYRSQCHGGDLESQDEADRIAPRIILNKLLNNMSFPGTVDWVDPFATCVTNNSGLNGVVLVRLKLTRSNLWVVYLD